MKMIVTIGILLAVGIVLVAVISSLRSTSRDRNGYYHTPGDPYIDSSGPHHAASHEVGSWGGRDMSHDHHNFGDSGDSGGGDAGGGDGGGGGGE